MYQPFEQQCPEGFSIKVSGNAMHCNVAVQNGKQSGGVNCKQKWEDALCSTDSILPEPCPDPTTICSGIRPNPSFQCYGGVWVANSSIEMDNDVMVLGGGGTTQVTGNLTVFASTLNFDGLGTLVVDECLRLFNSSIRLDLSKSDIENMVNIGSRTKTLLKSNMTSTVCGGEGDTLQTVPISLSQPKSCKKVSISQVGGESATLLTITFKIDKSSCSTWWIVLVSVLGAVMLLIIIAVVLVSFVPAIKRKVRPFWVRKNRTAESQPTRSGTGLSKACECCSDGHLKPGE